jgi:hypothetical protein
MAPPRNRMLHHIILDLRPLTSWNPCHRVCMRGFVRLWDVTSDVVELGDLGVEAVDLLGRALVVRLVVRLRLLVIHLSEKT